MKSEIDHLARPFVFDSLKPARTIILFVHGFTASPTELYPLAKALHEASNREWELHSILLPGHGIAGYNGFKALDNYTWNDWINNLEDKVFDLRQKHPNKPLFLIGLSMGAVLICKYLASLSRKKSKENKILGSILLSPAFAIQGMRFKFVPILKYLVKYQEKNEKSIKFLKKYKLFSYYFRSLSAVDELRKLINSTKKELSGLEFDFLIIISSSDETINVKKSIMLANKLKIKKIKIIENFSHIFPVESGTDLIFREIFEWIIDHLI